MPNTPTPTESHPDLKMNMDDDAEEITRKVAVAPSMSVMPSFMPIPTATTNPNSMMIRTSPTTKVAPSVSSSSSSTTSTQPFVWQLNKVPSLPEFHHLEQTATFVPNTASDPSIVAERISAILRERSIEAHYNDVKAKVKCTTIDGVEFRIRLYQGRGEKYDHGIIVELQRRFGTSLCFHEVIRSILDGAQGKPTKNRDAMPSPTSLPQVSAIIDDEDEDDEVGDADINADSSLAMVARMMKLPGFDSQYLGLQILSSLVDSEKLSSSTARAVATKLFEQPNSNNEVGVKVFGCIVNHPKDFDGDKNHMILRNMCLTILSNSLQAYNGGRLPADFDPDREQALRQVLVQDLMNAKQHPNTALLAAKCMEYFLSSSNNTTNVDCGNAFAIAQQVGKESNANLFRQVEKCMIKIQ